MPSADQKSVLGSVTALVRRISEGLQLRLELLGLELQEEKQRTIGLLLTAMGLAGALILALLSLHALLFVLFWEARLLLAALLLGGDLLLALGFYLALRRRLRRDSLPFSATLAEIRRDRELIRGGDE